MIYARKIYRLIRILRLKIRLSILLCKMEMHMHKRYGLPPAGTRLRSYLLFIRALGSMCAWNPKRNN